MKLLVENLKKCNIMLTNTQIYQFEVLKEELKSWNEKINLTSIVDDEEIINKHFVDSLIPEKFIKNGDLVIDVGTGAGFPGLPLKIYKKNSEFVLLDAVNKKLLFIDDVIQKAKLQNIKTIHGRAEDYAKNICHREKYDIAISRAVANMSVLVEYLLPFVKVGGQAICMKGPNIEEELNNSKFAIEKLGGKIEKIEKYFLPNFDNKYNIIVIKKIKNCPLEYPRQAAVIKKKPVVK